MANNKQVFSKQTVLIALGSGLEYYDFILFGMLASTMAHVFFPDTNSAVALIKTYALFGLTYLIRPIGGVIFGHLGDKYGRKTCFNHSILLMAFATLGIGLMPSYSSIGSSATFGLLLLRCLQGLAQGAELPGAITLICEVNSSRQSTHSAVLFTFVGFGAALASLMVYGLTHFFSAQQLFHYAWRIPFILGGLIAFAAAYCRRNSMESPLFDVANQEKTPLLTLLKSYPVALITGVALMFFPSVLIVFKVSFPVLFANYYHYSASQVYLALTYSLLFASFYQIVAGILADNFGQRRLYLIISCVAFFMLPGLFHFIERHSFIHLVLGLCLLQVIVSMLIASYLPLLANSFPTSVRYSGIAIIYNMTYSLAALSPMIVSYALNNGWSLDGVFTVIACLTIPGMLVVLWQFITKPNPTTNKLPIASKLVVNTKLAGFSKEDL